MFALHSTLAFTATGDGAQLMLPSIFGGTSEDGFSPVGSPRSAPTVTSKLAVASRPSGSLAVTVIVAVPPSPPPAIRVSESPATVALTTPLSLDAAENVRSSSSGSVQ